MRISHYLVMRNLRKHGCFLCKYLLRDISSNGRVNSGNVCHNFLKNKAGQLPPNVRIINIQLNEIHIKTKVVYENGKVFQYVGNKTSKEANRLQCFLIASLYSDN